MEPLRHITELPFREGEMLDVLGLRQPRDTLVLDDYSYGFCRIGSLLLESRRGAPARRVRDVLLLAMHAAEDPERLPDDIELEFWVDEVADDYSLTVLLSHFLDNWLPLVVRGTERAVVLTVCNKYDARLRPPAAARGLPVCYGLGDVDTWGDERGGEVHPRLVADEWLIAR